MWCGVTKLINAMTTLINEPRACGHVFSIGNGEEISIRDLALRVRKTRQFR